MASRESQGLQIALILSVFLIIGLGVTTFVYYSKSERERQRADQLNERVQTANSDRDTAQFKYQALKFMIDGGVVIDSVDAAADPMKQIADTLETELMSKAPGALQDPEVTQLAQNYYQHMAAFGLDSDLQRNYANLPDHLLQVVSKSNDRIVTLQNSNETLIGEKSAIETREIERSKQFEQQMLAARNDRDKAQEAYDTERKRIVSENQGYFQDVQKKQNDLVQAQQRVKETEDRLNKEVDRLAEQNKGFRLQLQSLKEDSFESPDGRITVVDHKLRICYIDVGEADGLQRQQTFSVYDAGQTAAMKSEPKGRIEVIQYIDDHLTLCKVLEDDATNLIAPGDVIHTPAWGPGRRVHFVMAGFIDLDGDGQSDRERLATLIERVNNGVIDDEVTPQTRWLVMGERRSDSPGATEMSPAELNDYNRKVSDATQIGVDQISVDRLLAYMGWKGDVRVISLGQGNTGQLKMESRKATGRTSAGSQADQFRPRTPPRGNNGAF